MSPWPRADERRCQVRLADGMAASCTMPPGPTRGTRTVRTAKPCGPGRRCYGQVPADAAVAPTGVASGDFHGMREARRNFGSRESTAYAVRPSRREGRAFGHTCMLLCGLFRVCISRGRPRVPAGARPSLRPLDREGEEKRKARAKHAARLRKRVCGSRCELLERTVASYSVIASAARSEAIHSPSAEGFWIASLRSQ